MMSVLFEPIYPYVNINTISNASFNEYVIRANLLLPTAIFSVYKSSRWHHFSRISGDKSDFLSPVFFKYSQKLHALSYLSINSNVISPYACESIILINKQYVPSKEHNGSKP